MYVLYVYAREHVIRRLEKEERELLCAGAGESAGSPYLKWGFLVYRSENGKTAGTNLPADACAKIVSAGAPRGRINYTRRITSRKSLVVIWISGARVSPSSDTRVATVTLYYDHYCCCCCCCFCHTFRVKNYY